MCDLSTWVCMLFNNVFWISCCSGCNKLEFFLVVILPLWCLPNIASELYKETEDIGCSHDQELLAFWLLLWLSWTEPPPPFLLLFSSPDCLWLCHIGLPHCSPSSSSHSIFRYDLVVTHSMSHFYILLRFCNSCQLCLCLCLSSDYLSTNSVPRRTTVAYHIIIVPLFSRTFLQDSLSYSRVLPYVTIIRSSSVDINSDSLLFISTLDLAFQGTGMHGTIFIIYHMQIPCLRNSL